MRRDKEAAKPGVSLSRVAIVGAGAAGATLSWLLARRGIHVTLLERRRDFAREFRGEVLMPSGVEALEQMGLRDVLEKTPSRVQQEVAFTATGARDVLLTV